MFINELAQHIVFRASLATFCSRFVPWYIVFCIPHTSPPLREPSLRLQGHFIIILNTLDRTLFPQNSAPGPI